MHLANFSYRHARAIVFLSAALTLAGIWAYVRTPASIFPEMRFSRISVVAEAGNLPPEQARITLALPLEREFLGLPSVRRVVATSALGSTELIVEFDPATDAQGDLQYVESAIARARPDLPATTTVEANILTPQTEPVLSYAFTSTSLSQTLLREYAQRAILPALYGAPGLARAIVAGGPEREYHVDLDAAALASSGLSAQDVRAALAGANEVTAAGVVEAYSQRAAVLVDGALRDANDLSRVAVPTRDGNSVPLSSLGSVGLGVAPATNAFSGDDVPGVGINMYALPGADNVRMAQAVKQRLAVIERRLPAGTRLSAYWDATDLIVASQESLRDAIFAGALLALGVIYFFLRNLRMTLVAAIVIPVAMSIAVLAIALLGQTLNIMSVGGLAIAVGLIIDDAIVVVEGIAAAGDAQVSMSRLARPMIASTLATVVVFLPLGLLGGVAGAFFRTLALTLSCALLVSLALALFVTPLIFRSLAGGATSETGSPAMGGLSDRYEAMLLWALGHRRAMYAIGGGILVATLALIAILPSDFLPRLDEGQFEIAYSIPVGSTLAASDAAASEIERIVLADPAVAAEGRITGIDTNGFTPTPVRSGILRAKLKPLGARASFDVVSDRLRNAIAASIPAAQLDIHQILEDLINDISGAPAPIEVVVTGPDQSVLASVATRISAQVGKIPGVADAFSGVTADDPILRVVPQLSRATRAGSDPAGIADALAASMQGTVGTAIASDSMQVPVRVAVLGSAGALPDAIALGSGSIPVAQVARTIVDRSTTDVEEINGQRAIVVTANIASGSLSGAIGGVRAAIARAQIPPGYRVSIEGAYQAQQDSFRDFALAIAIAVLLVFFVVLVTFRSFRQPIVMLAAVALAPIGVAIALVVTRTPLNVSSFMGMLLLVGLVVKNGILLLDAANRRRAEGHPVEEALSLAGRERLRPILMTTFAAIGGLLPLAFGIGAGAAMEQPLAIAVVGGLTTATFFTLLLIPVLYASFVSGEVTA
jgi:multidrug efflux pump subunit AcrB